MPLYGKGGLQAFGHVEGVSVRAKADEDVFLKHLQHRRAAYGIAHVGLRVVHNHGVCFFYDVHLRGIDVDAVPKERLFPENPKV